MDRLVQCGRHTIGWDQVELVAGYIIMETAFSKNYGFSQTHCWWAAIVSTERIRQPRNWLFMLYLASNFSSTDTRDAIYGLLGLIELSGGGLEPDYSKSPMEVYQDSVREALIQFQRTDVLLYATGNETPSWAPRWNRPMLFRNPFRFGKSLPWKPAGDSKPIWHIDSNSNVLSLHGFVIGSIQLVEQYNESYFSNAMIDSNKGKNDLTQSWGQILSTLNKGNTKTPFTDTMLAAIATSLAFGLDEASNPCDGRLLMRNFVAYLKLVLDEDTYNKFIPLEVSEESAQANGHVFGKPVWDFKYPDSSIFTTDGGLVGCCVSTTMPGDVVSVAFGSTYPFVLRPDGEKYLLKGYAFVHGTMHGEQCRPEGRVMKIH
ncbi:hypothetical protein HIM_05451 [Hirsutella minnesotensis 3608]|uniref:Heterokaryon incompatibility domain-containing protein n=1 Tax=Hirsutella minnesotensis 3608 TaxID=1043627 RepID=A0A0F8A0D7_9HYPO|nr:hypothetical protein HIM_05451 [Hirsutella minnesotensis 3608]